MRRRAFEHTTAPYRAPHSFWRQQAPHTTSSGTKLALCVQNCPIWRILLLLGEFFPATANNKPRTPPVPVPVQNSPSASRAVKHLPPQHHTQTRAMKHLSPQHHTQTRAMKHLSPQHATNNPKSPIFTTQGRTFFHNTHHPHNTHPHQGELSFNHRHQNQANQQSHAIPHRPTPTQPHNPQNSNDQASHHETPMKELHAKLLERCGQAPRKVARNSIG